jgi:hypothetical protein
MRKRMSSVLGSLCAVVGLAAMCACGGGSGQINVTSIAISPTSGTVALNTQLQLSATVNLANTTSTSETNTTVTWYVNGVAGGNSSVGTITTSTLSNQTGIYTAPGTQPANNNGQVSITAQAPQFPGSTTNTATITSNTALIQVGVGAGLSVSPVTASVPAGGNLQFTGILNNVTTTNVTWAISSTNGGDIGTIDSNTGLYTAPLFPPPGGVITVTATSPQATAAATATANIVYSDASLTGPFAFSYVGNNTLGYIAAAGSLVADGNGKITSGLFDSTGFLGGPSSAISFTGTYAVGPDGRGSIVLSGGGGSGTTIQFVLTNNQHAYITRFNAGTSGTGAMDQQNLNDLTTSPSVISGPYVFEFTGSDATFQQLGVAGRFTANGAGTIPNTGATVDFNDNGTVTANDTSLAGTYKFDTTQPNTGRGTMTLTSTAIGTLNFAFYTIDSTHLRVVETDTSDYLAGDVYSGIAGPFNVGNLAKGNFAFTVGGTSAAGAYALGGVLTSDGAGNISGGVSDLNDAGTATLATTLGGCTYTSDATNSRIDLTIGASGSCTTEFAGYPTSTGSVLLLELDSAAVAGGTAYLQLATAAPAGALAIGLGSQGIFYNSSAQYGQDLDAAVNFRATVAGAGSIDINNFNAVYPSDPVNTTTAIAAPSSLGRGTMILSGKNPNVTFGLVYYVVSPNLSLLLGSDTTRTNVGQIGLQY